MLKCQMADLAADTTPEALTTSHDRKSKNLNYRQRKRNPIQPSKNENDVYVTLRSDFHSQLKRVIKLFEDGNTEVVVHGLGAAVTRAANLSLQVKEKLSKTVVISVETDTVQLEDEWEPLLDEGVPYNTSRSNSALHIKITRLPGFPK